MPQMEWYRAWKRRIPGRSAARLVVQWGFLALVVMIGAQFALFVWQLERGREPPWESGLRNILAGR